jgi:hypothetical protein
LQNSAARLENKELRRRAVATELKIGGKVQKAARSAGQSAPNAIGGVGFLVLGSWFLVRCVLCFVFGVAVGVFEIPDFRFEMGR